MQPVMSAVEIIDSFVKYYSRDTSRRAHDSQTNTCSYLTSDGRCCAVGRAMTRASKQQYGEFFGGVYTLVSTIQEDNPEASLDDLLQLRYKGHPIGFWEALQNLHDTSGYWGKSSGLTPSGEVELEYLRSEWG